MRRRALVIASHPDSAGLADPGLPSADLVVAADGGLDAALRAGIAVDAVVGDLDSASPDALAQARRDGVRVEAHDARKDQTDLELAMEFARERAEEVHVVASARGRVDHALAAMAVLASPRWAGLTVSASVDSACIDVIRGRREIDGAVGDLLSLIVVGAPAVVAETCGLDYPLHGERLEPWSARGVSNVITAIPVVVAVTEGVVLAIRPKARDRGC